MQYPRFIIIFLLSFSITSTSFALERFDVISTQQMKSMLEDRKNGQLDFTLINALDEIIFRDKSLPGSINIPWSKVKEKASLLGANKDKLIVTYCMGYR